MTQLCDGTYNFTNARSHFPHDFGGGNIVLVRNLWRPSSRSSLPRLRLRHKPPYTSGQSIRQNVSLVDVLFTVLNRQNKIVADLNSENFRVFDA